MMVGTAMSTGSARDAASAVELSSRILVLGRTGSGKTTLARQLAVALGYPHVELDALYFGDEFSTVPLQVLRDRTRVAVGADCWVTDGNKSAVRDLVWPRAETVIWLDYPLAVSLWRLAHRAVRRTSTIKAQVDTNEAAAPVFVQMTRAARGVLRALRSHRGQRRLYPRMFAQPENQHLRVIRLRFPRATRRLLSEIVRTNSAEPVPTSPIHLPQHPIAPQRDR